MRRLLLLIVFGLLLGLAWAGTQPASKSAGLRCTLTNQKIEKCCCQMRDGKLYCPLAKKTIDACCCVPAEGQKAKKQATPNP